MIRSNGCTELLGSATDELLMPATVSESSPTCLRPELAARGGSGVLTTIRGGRMVPVDLNPADYTHDRARL